MRANNSRNLADLPGPWNLQQKIETVNHVGFDLRAFLHAEAALGYGKIADLFWCEDGPLDSARVEVRLSRDFNETVKLSFRKDRRLVCLEDGLESTFHLDPAQSIFLFERSNAGQRFRPIHFQQEVNFLAFHSRFHFHIEIIEAVRNEIDLHGI